MSGRGGSLTNAVAVARPMLQDVDVQVLGMRRIGPWAEYRCEPPACGDADGIERATQMFIPIRFDGQYFAVQPWAWERLSKNVQQGGLEWRMRSSIHQ